MRKLSRLAFPQARTRVPNTWLVKRAMPRRLAIENVARGRHDELRHSSSVEAPVIVRCWAMIAQDPAPAIASDIVVAQLTAVAMIVRTSRLRNCRSRVSSAPCTMPPAVNRNTSDRTANNGWILGSP